MALVTPRFKPFTVNGETVHQVGMTHHFGWAGEYATGDIVNDLPPNVGDPEHAGCPSTRRSSSTSRRS